MLANGWTAWVSDFVPAGITNDLGLLKKVDLTNGQVNLTRSVFEFLCFREMLFKENDENSISL
jgi:hypothetical protein